MNELVLLDNTVLCNFASVGRLGLLEAVLDGRGRLTVAVNQEMERSVASLPGLVSAVGAPWLGDPFLVGDGHGNVKVWRQGRLAGTKNDPLAHLGEAGSFHVLEKWPELHDSWFATDDRRAVLVARQGIVVGLTSDLLAMAARCHLIAPAEALDLIVDMEQAGRHPLRPGSVQELMDSYPYGRLDAGRRPGVWVASAAQFPWIGPIG